MHRIRPFFCAAALLLGCGVSALAIPGLGTPLAVTTGTVYTVASVSELTGAVRAANAAGVPATVLVEDGVYTLDGSALHIMCPGLIVRGASGDRDAAVIRGPDEGPSAATGNIFLISANNVTLADLTFGYCRWHGVQIQGESPHDVSGTRIHNCRIVNCNEQFIKGSSGDDPVGATDGVIENCWFEFTDGWAYQYYTGGIDIHKGVNWVVRGNRFESIRTPGELSHVAEHAIHFWKRCPTRPQNIVVERNWIINCDRGIGFGLGGFDGGHFGGGSVIRNNLISNDGAGAHTDVGIGLENASDVRIDNNTVYIPTYWAPMEYRFAGSSNLTFRNNLLNSPIRNRDGAPVAVFSENIDTAPADWFVDASAGDVRLAPAATEAINRGMPIPEFADDVDASPRPALGGWDIGAHEYRPAWAARPAPNLSSFDQGRIPTREIHVAPSGQDATGDGSIGSPYRTLAHAAQFAVPGVAVVLAPGTYPGGTLLSDLSGTQAAPIWIRGADPANRPVISGGGVGIHLVRARHLVVENLEVSGCANNGINCDDGGDYANPDATRQVVFRNLHIHDIGGTGNQDGLKLSGLDDYRVLDCAFARCGGGGSGSGIDLVGCHRGAIARCRFQQMSGNGIQCKGGSAEIDILNCRFIDAGQRGINIGGSTGFAYFRPPLSASDPNVEARDIRVVANVFTGATTPVAFVGCIDSVVANNTIVNPEDWFLRILQETVSSPPYTFLACRESAFVNNLVYFDRARMKSTDINVGAHTDPGSFLFAGNLWYAHDAPGHSAPDYPVTEIQGMVGQDPLPANPAAGDFAITLASPAAGAGWMLGTGWTDATGRPYLNPPSVGATEINGDLDGDLLDDFWEVQYFGTIHTTSGAEDADADRFRDREEYLAGTDPTDATSRLLFTDIRTAPSGGLRLRWPGAPGRVYRIYRATTLADPPAFALLTNGLTATATTEYTDPDPHRMAFYQIGAYIRGRF